jgi:hypothetical protein
MPTRSAPLPLLALAVLAGCAARTSRPAPVAPPVDGPVGAPAPLRLPRWTPGVRQAPARAQPAVVARSYVAPDAGASPSRASDEVRRALEATRLPGLALRAEPSLRAVCSTICGYARVNLHVDEAAEDAVRASGTTFGLARTSPISAASALDLVMELAGDDVAWTTRYGAVLVTTPAKARGPARLSVFDISDLTSALPSYAARELNLAPSGGLTEAEDVGRLEREPQMSESLLEDLIRNTIAPGTWEEPGNSLTIRGGKLIVRHD